MIYVVRSFCMKKTLCLLLILVLLPTINIFADEIENARILMEEGEVGDIVKLYIIPPNDKNIYIRLVNLYFDSNVFEYIDSEFLNTDNLTTYLSVGNNCIATNVEHFTDKQICLMAFLKIKSDGDPSFYLTEYYMDRNCNDILERSGKAEYELIEKNAGVPVYTEPPYSIIEIFTREKFALISAKHDMSGTILAAAYDENEKLIDIASYKPSAQVILQPFSSASYVKIMWWDKETLLPVCSAKSIKFN